MADTFLEFARGDLIATGASISGILAEVQDGSLSVANGAQLIKFLRSGVGGWHIGTLEGTASFKMAIIRAGMKQDFVKLVFSKKPVCSIQFIWNDVARITVSGIMQGFSGSFGESTHLVGDFAVHGRVDYRAL